MENKDCVDCKDKLVKAVEGNDFFYKHHIYNMYFKGIYEGWNCNSGNYLFTTDTK
jgi:hypothetical protein